MSVVDMGLLYDEILPHTPGATIQIAMHYIQLAVREFCTRTQAWNFITDPLDITAGESFLDSESIVSCAEPCAIMQVWYKEVPILPLVEDQYIGRLFVEAATPQRWTGVPNALGIHLWPTPLEDEPGAVRLRIALRPKRTVTQVDADLYNQWYPVLAEGAKARMFMIPKKPYSDASMAKESRREFLKGIADARWKKVLGHTPATVAVVPPPFGV